MQNESPITNSPKENGIPKSNFITDNNIIFFTCPRCGAENFIGCRNCQKYDSFEGIHKVEDQNYALCSCGNKVFEVNCNCRAIVHGKNFFIDKEKEIEQRKVKYTPPEKSTLGKPLKFWQGFLWVAFIIGGAFLMNYICNNVKQFSTIKVGEEIIVPTSTPITNSIGAYGTMLMLSDSGNTQLLVDMNVYGSLFYVEKGTRLKALSVEGIPDDTKQLYFQSITAKSIKNMVKIRVLDGKHECKEGWVSSLQFFMSR